MTHNGRKFRGVVLDPPTNGSMWPIGCFKVTQAGRSGFQVMTDIEVSSKAARGIDQVKETVHGLQRRAEMIPSVKGNTATVSVKQSTATDDDDDELSKLWEPILEGKGEVSGTFSSSSSKREQSQPSTSAPKRNKINSGGLVALQLSEAVALMGQHMLDAITLCTDFQRLPAAGKLNGVIKAVAGRLDERFVQIYAADCNSQTSAGMATLEKLRSIHNLLLKCKPLVDSVSPKSDSPLAAREISISPRACKRRILSSCPKASC